MPQNVIIIGAGGHAKVVADIIVKSGDKVLGFLDDNSMLTEVMGYPVLGRICDIDRYRDKAAFVIGIGSNSVRAKLAQICKIKWYTAIHPSAQIGMEVSVGCGTVVMANAVINSSAQIGRHCIINTGAVIEHDNKIADYVHASPGAVLCGTVSVGEFTHIGAGAVIRNNISIGSHTVIGAGAVVVKDIVQAGIYVGVPAKKLLE